jgi:osmotically-inducible protein OsmY
MTKKTDAELREAVVRELQRDGHVEPRLQVSVEGGIITLTGKASDWEPRPAAQEAPSVATEDLRRAICAALRRQVEREANDIELEVEDGQVVLRGVVHSWREREAVLGAVKGTPGVRTVQHTIRVDPDA